MSRAEDNNDIIIDSVGGPDEGQDLMGCYFIYNSSNHTFNFFDKNGNQLNTGLQLGEHFHFVLTEFPFMKWKLHISKKSTPTLVTGKWKEKPVHADFGDDEWEPDQSYQAQAGGSGNAEGEMNAAAASAQ